MSKIVKLILQYFAIAFVIIIIVTVGSIIFSFVRLGQMDIQYIFTGNFATGGVILFMGIVALIFPATLVAGKDKLLDHSTFTERVMGVREKKRVKAYDLLYVGIGIVAMTGIMEYILWVLA
ncbi:MAG: hypothetical protein FWE05_03420 [Defluviitaleaceae bacterium]|nr:hypothetical protein [Defluviitaleaceae bacterium]